MYVAQERLYLTKEGRIVTEGDPEAYSLFVPKGGYVPFQLAEKHGLTNDPAPEPTGTPEPELEAQTAAEQTQEQKARGAPPKTKHRAGPPETKGVG